MPLIQGYSKDTLEKNYQMMRDEGKSEAQSWAIAYDVQRKSQEKEGKPVTPKPQTEALKSFLKSLITNDNHAVMEAIAHGYANIFEGYSIIRPIDRERYTDIPGLEGPFQMPPAGRIVYYDPSVGRYYDRDRDMYLEGDEADEFSKPWPHAVNENVDENSESITIPLPTDPQGVDKVKQELTAELDAYKNASEVTKGAMAAQTQAEENLRDKTEDITEEYEREKQTQARDASGTM